MRRCRRDTSLLESSQVCCSLDASAKKRGAPVLTATKGCARPQTSAQRRKRKLWLILEQPRPRDVGFLRCASCCGGWQLPIGISLNMLQNSKTSWPRLPRACNLGHAPEKDPSVTFETTTVGGCKYPALGALLWLTAVAPTHHYASPAVGGKCVATSSRCMPFGARARKGPCDNVRDGYRRRLQISCAAESAVAYRSWPKPISMKNCSRREVLGHACPEHACQRTRQKRTLACRYSSLRCSGTGKSLRKIRCGLPQLLPAKKWHFASAPG